MLKIFVAFSMLLAVMCASGGGGARPADVAAAEVTVRLRSPLFFGSGREAPASFEVDVTNRATVPPKPSASAG